MLYGAAVCVVLALLQGQSFAPPAVVSQLSEAIAPMLAFACFLTLQERIGPGPTASIGVMTPLLALVVSTAFRGLPSRCADVRRGRTCRGG